MKRILVVLAALLVATAFPAWGQENALEERVNKIYGYMQDLLAAQDAQRKQIEALAADLQSLREKVGQPDPSGASQEDLRKLAEKIQEVDDKRKADTDRIAKEIEELGKAVRQKPATRPPEAPVTNASSEKGYWYEIKPNDTLSAVIAAYREQGIKVTLDEILKANPGLEPTKMQVGRKIWIPAPKE